MAASTAAHSCAAPVSPPAASPRSARFSSAQCARPRPGRRRLAGAQVTVRKSICTHCSVGCTVTAEVANDIWIGQEPSWDSPINRGSHCAKGASVRELVSGERRLEISDEACERPVDPRVLGSGDRRDRRQDDGDPRAVGTGFGLLARLRQDDQRRLLSVPKIRRVLGHQQYRSPGAHLPFDHGHRRRQYLGLRRHDQQLQRYPQFQDTV